MAIGHKTLKRKADRGKLKNMKGTITPPTLAPLNLAKDSFDNLMTGKSQKCEMCYFKGKEPMIAIYPKDDDMYPFKEGETESFSLYEIQQGLIFYLQNTLADFNTREGAEDFLLQMAFQVSNALDEVMGTTTPEKMSEYQHNHLTKIATKMKPEVYEARYEKWKEHYFGISSNESSHTVTGVDGFIDELACRQAYEDAVMALKKQIKQLESEKSILSTAVDTLNNKLSANKEKLLTQEASYTSQIKGLMKDIKGLEADMRRMEKQNGGRGENNAL